MTALAVLAAVGVYVGLHVLRNGVPLKMTSACTVRADKQVTLGPDQMANAATIAAIGIRRGLPERAVVVALAAGLQESKLKNLDGGDRDSIGLFQQRPSQGWGTAAQIADPRYATNEFYNGLLKVPGWQQMRVTDAAQAVQRSAHPEAYQKWVDQAEALATAFLGQAGAAVTCTLVGQPPVHGAAAATSLFADMRADWGDVQTVAAQGLLGVALSVGEDRVGWQYAHWLVAHAQEQGIKRVRFGDREWTARGGAWTRVTPSDPRAAGERVVAEVYS
ncbi:MAG TPA: hypothetical protein VF054_20730 [Micromonosporaceae bacterium]